MLYMIFKYCWEPVLIQRISIGFEGFEAILEKIDIESNTKANNNGWLNNYERKILKNKDLPSDMKKRCEEYIFQDKETKEFACTYQNCEYKNRYLSIFLIFEKQLYN